MPRAKILFEDAELRRVMADRALPTYADKARFLGCGVRTLAREIKRLNLRPSAKGPAVSYDPDLLRAAWAAGVASRSIAAHFDLDPSTISHAATMLGLPPRKPGFRAPRTWEQFWAARRAAEAREARKAARKAADAAAALQAAQAAREDRPALPPDMRGPVCADAARQLFQAVLLEMWRTALSLVVTSHVGEFELASTRRWFGSPDFYLVCQFAGVEGDLVLARYRAARARLAERPRLPNKHLPALERIVA